MDPLPKSLKEFRVTPFPIFSTCVHLCSKGKSHQLLWSKESVEEMIKLFKEGKLEGGYGKGQVDAISSHIEKHAAVKDKRVLVSI